jgi:preprotein translocase subunit SecF
MKLLKLVPDNTNIDFMKWRNIALILSIIATVGSLVLVGVRGLNLGIDFVGGQVVRATFAQPVNIEDLRGKVATLNVGEASIQEFGDNKTYQIRLPKPEGPDAAANQVVTAVRALIIKDYPGVKVTAGESVSGKVSGELAWDAWPSASRCWASPSTSGSGSNGSSAWGHWSPCSTTLRWSSVSLR